MWSKTRHIEIFEPSFFWQLSLYFHCVPLAVIIFLRGLRSMNLISILAECTDVRLILSFSRPHRGIESTQHHEINGFTFHYWITCTNHRVSSSVNSKQWFSSSLKELCIYASKLTVQVLVQQGVRTWISPSIISYRYYPNAQSLIKVLRLEEPQAPACLGLGAVRSLASL